MTNRGVKQKQRFSRSVTTATKKAQKLADNNSNKRKRVEDEDDETVMNHAPSGGRRLQELDDNKNGDKENRINSQARRDDVVTQKTKVSSNTNRSGGFTCIGTCRK